MAKFHHKLYILNTYLRKDFQLSRKMASNKNNYIQLAVKTLGVSLKNRKIAKTMYPLMSKVGRFYLNSKSKYNLKVAILVSRHNVMTSKDYRTLNNILNRTNKRNLRADVQKAKGKAYIKKPTLLARIF